MIGNAFWDIWTGDIVSLTLLWFMFLPFVLIYAGFAWLKDKVKK